MNLDSSQGPLHNNSYEARFIDIWFQKAPNYYERVKTDSNFDTSQ